MCCFSRPVDRVANTNIFARSSKDGRQFVVYSMTLSAKEDLAMILPVPTPRNPSEDAVRFINLEKYTAFFTDLQAGFPNRYELSRSMKSDGPLPGRAAPLKVVEVGSFDASFVPTVKDFARLDERFRLPMDTWDTLPQYKAFGFVVFKFRKGAATIHPMAFEFPRAYPKHLFFPTVHIHDGMVHEKADFDHSLFCQKTSEDDTDLLNWQESPQPAGLFMKMDKAQGLLLKDAHCYRLKMKGNLKNEDVLA